MAVGGIGVGDRDMAAIKMSNQYARRRKGRVFVLIVWFGVWVWSSYEGEAGALLCGRARDVEADTSFTRTNGERVERIYDDIEDVSLGVEDGRRERGKAVEDRQNTVGTRRRRQDGGSGQVQGRALLRRAATEESRSE